MQGGKIFQGLLWCRSNGAETEVFQSEEILWNNEENDVEVRKNIVISDSLSIKLCNDHFFDEFIP